MFACSGAHPVKHEEPDCDLALYFTQQQLHDMPTIEKLLAVNKMKNYRICKSLDLECALPGFMMREVAEAQPPKQGSSLVKLSEDLKKQLLFSDIPLSFYAAHSEHGKNSSLQLPLCKNSDRRKEIWDNLCSVAPVVIKKFEEDYSMKKKALELFKDKKIGMKELEVFFPTSMESLRETMKGLSLEERKGRTRGTGYYNLRENIVKKSRFEGSVAKEEKQSSSSSSSSSLNVRVKVEAIPKVEIKRESGTGSSQSAEATSDTDTDCERRSACFFPMTFAAKTLPEGLVLRRSLAFGSLPGVFARAAVRKGSVFGPFVGPRLLPSLANEEEPQGSVWEIFVDGCLDHFVDGNDPERSNWMRYVNRSGRAGVQNLEAFQLGRKVYYRATRRLQSGDELVVWYSRDYNEDWKDDDDDDDDNDDDDDDDDDDEEREERRDVKTVKTSAPFKLPDFDVRLDANDGVLLCSRKTSRRPPPLSSSFQAKGTDARERAPGKKEEKEEEVGRIFDCKACGRVFSAEHVALDHSTMHTGERRYRCDVCGKSFRWRGNAGNHRRMHADRLLRRCELCGARFLTRRQMREHSALHDRSSGDLFHCRVCGRAFGRSQYANIHAKRVHGVLTKRAPRRCRAAGEEVSMPGSLPQSSR